MSILPTETEDVAVRDDMDAFELSFSWADRVVPLMFAVLAGTAMMGWLYLIARGLLRFAFWIFL